MEHRSVRGGRVRRVGALGLVAIALLVLPGCRTAVAGTRCTGSGWAVSASGWALRCRQGRWVRVAPVAELLERLRTSQAASTTTTTTPSTSPETTTTTTSTTSTTTTSTTSTTTTSTTTTTIAPAPPAVVGISPSYGLRAGGSAVTIFGSGFTGATDVLFGDVASPYFVTVGDGSITAISPPHAAGFVDITVVTPGGTSPVGVDDEFLYQPVPILTSVAPSTGVAAGGQTILVSGFYLTDATAVSFGSTPAASFTVLSDSQMLVVTPAHAVGDLEVTVTSPTGSSDIIGTSNFSFVSPQATRLSTGQYSTCAVVPDTTVACWGYNASGQLGDNSQTNRTSPVTVQGLTGATDVSVGADHACAVVSGGVRCWGSNTYGQLGDGTVTLSTTPVTVTGLDDAVVVSVAAGQFHSCALLANQTVRCWGRGTSGQLGQGLSSSSRTAVEVYGLTGARQITAGGSTTCVVRDFQGFPIASCWGLNSSGQLGDGTTTNSNVPVDIGGLNNPAEIRTGPGGLTVCALRASRQVLCWGSNSTGQVGDGTLTDRLTPTAVVTLPHAIRLSVGANHACAIVEGGSLRCWGNNGAQQLGDGSSTTRKTQVVSLAVTRASAVWTGNRYTCALDAAGAVTCWGTNSFGQAPSTVPGW